MTYYCYYKATYVQIEAMLKRTGKANKAGADCNLGKDTVYLSQPVTTDVPETFWMSVQSNDFITHRHLASEHFCNLCKHIERLFSVAGAIILLTTTDCRPLLWSHCWFVYK